MQTHINLWGNNEIFTLLAVTDKDGRDGEISEITKYIDLINSNLSWLEENKTLIEKALVQQNASNLARIWTEQADLKISYENNNDDENDDNTFAEIDSVKFAFPVTDKDFLQSLNLSGLSIEVEENSTESQNCYILIYFECIPDYFSGNSLEVEISQINGERNIEFCGIVG